jgi:hypothetical protein
MTRVGDAAEEGKGDQGQKKESGGRPGIDRRFGAGSHKNGSWMGGLSKGPGSPARGWDSRLSRSIT